MYAQYLFIIPIHNTWFPIEININIVQGRVYKGDWKGFSFPHPKFQKNVEVPSKYETPNFFYY